MTGDTTIEKNISSYQPSQDIIDFTALVKKDFEYGEELLNRPWPELNDRSVIEDENRGKMMFNAFVDTSTEDPSEAWKWRGTRSKARNKGIAMHASLTAAYLLPLFTAKFNSKIRGIRRYDDFLFWIFAKVPCWKVD